MNNQIKWIRPNKKYENLLLTSAHHWLNTKLDEIKYLLNNNFLKNLETFLNLKINSIEIIESPKRDFLLNGVITIEILSGIEFYKNSLKKSGKPHGYNSITNKNFPVDNGITNFDRHQILFSWYDYFDIDKFIYNNTDQKNKISNEILNIIGEQETNTAFWTHIKKDYLIPFYVNHANFGLSEYLKCETDIKEDIYQLIFKWIESLVNKWDKKLDFSILKYIKTDALTQLINNIASYTWNKLNFYHKGGGVRSAVINENHFLSMILKRQNAEKNADYIVLPNFLNLKLTDSALEKLNKIWNDAWNKKPKNIFILGCLKINEYLKLENNKFSLDIFPNYNKNQILLYKKNFLEIKDAFKDALVLSYTGEGDAKTQLSGWKTEPYESWKNRFDFIFADPPYFLSNSGMSVKMVKEL